MLGLGGHDWATLQLLLNPLWAQTIRRGERGPIFISGGVVSICFDVSSRNQSLRSGGRITGNLRNSPKPKGGDRRLWCKPMLPHSVNRGQGASPPHHHHHPPPVGWKSPTTKQWSGRAASFPPKGLSSPRFFLADPGTSPHRICIGAPVGLAPINKKHSNNIKGLFCKTGG